MISQTQSANLTTLQTSQTARRFLKGHRQATHASAIATEVGRQRQRVFCQTVARCTPYWRAKTVVLAPVAWAVRIASTSFTVSGVRVRPLGSAEAPIRGLATSPPSSGPPENPWPRAKTSFSTARRRFE